MGARGQGTQEARLDGLQAGRALAATMVAVFHANNYILPDKIYNGEGAHPVLGLGYSGVEFFFVLSGFIMVFIHSRDFGKPDRTGIFLAKRFLRIYLLYWLILAAVAATAAAIPGLGPETLRDPAVLAGSALLLPMTVPPVIEVAWSLTHEILFYLIFALLIAKPSVGWVAFGAWMAGCAAMAVGKPFSFPLDVVFSAYNFLFPLGMLAAFQFGRVHRQQALVALIGGAVLFLGVGLSDVLGEVDWNKSLRTLLYGVGAMLIVIGLAAGALRTPSLLVLLGNASYSIYLIHLPVMSVIAKIACILGLQALPPLIMLVLLVAAAEAIGVVLHLVLERPLLSAVR